jgi:ATP-dependent DNA helicase DinG
MSPSLLSKLIEVPVAVLDVETTGSSPRRGDRVIEIGIARYERGRCVERFGQLINPCRSVPDWITDLTGITPLMLGDAPTFDEARHDVRERLAGAVLVGHNAPFDLGFLDGEFRHVGSSLVETVGAGAVVIDTVRLARRAFGRGGNRLQSLAARFKLPVGQAHRALDDALVTAALLERLLEPTGWSSCLADVLAAQGGVCRLPGLAA